MSSSNAASRALLNVAATEQRGRPLTQPNSAGAFTLTGPGNESVYLYLTPSQDNPVVGVRFPAKLHTGYGKVLSGVAITLL